MDLVKAISESGILIVIAGVFLYTYLTDKKKSEDRDNKYNSSLVLLSESNNNIAKALDLLNTNACNNDKLLREHDARSVIINERVLEIKNAATALEKKTIRKEKREQEKKGE